MGVLKITLFHTRDAFLTADSVRQKQVAAGNAFLRRQRLKFDVSPPVGNYEINYEGMIDKSAKTKEGRAQREALRAAAHAACPSGHGRLPVILCRIQGGGGESPGSLGAGGNWLPHVIMDVFDLNADNLTLLHEAGHCAGLRHPGEDPLIDSQDIDNIMSYGQKGHARTVILQHQIDALRKAYFHQG